MDRKQAQDNIGKLVLVNEGIEGMYVGKLIEIIAPPRKTWRGVVTIQGIAQLPEFQAAEPIPLKYIENDMVECIGSKLDLLENEEFEHLSFPQSIGKAASERLNALLGQSENIEAEKAMVIDLLSNFGFSVDVQKTEEQRYVPKFDFEEAIGTPEEVKSEEVESEVHELEETNKKDNQENDQSSFYFYTEDNGRYILVDTQGEQLDLEDCPFEFTWGADQEEVGHYEGNGVFISKEGKSYTAQEGDIFGISEKQFEPYFIFQNELEPEALLSLEKNLKDFGVTHEDIITCQNTLLSQFLHAHGQKEFKGVNFLIYQGKLGFVMVQHHFERKLHDDSNDEIYDRFELTTEAGKRAIATFTNEFSK